jgi:putative protease
MEFLHQRGVRGYVTFNTLIFENELAAAAEFLRAIIAAGVDAAIVQDVGICRLIRELSPDFPIHASTQMTLTSVAGIDFARDLGCCLVVLARECSLADIEKIQAAEKSTMPLEVFVHGALCVAYSGQCLTSESLGGRSANRGECAQACRLPYELMADGKFVSLGDKKYLLSPQDLAGLDLLPEIVRAGVASLKIEGRLKAPEYVASITRIYRQALDELRFTNDAGSAADAPARKAELAQRKYEMEMAFSRGLFTGWFGGTDNRQLVHARFGKKRGAFLGEIKKIVRDGVILELAAPAKPGDGIVFDAGHPDEKEEGGRIYEVQAARFQIPGHQLTELRFGYKDIDYLRVHVGDKLWKTDDPELNKRVRQSYDGKIPKFQRPIEIEVRGQVGQPLTLTVRDEGGHAASATSAMPLAQAEKLPLTTEKLREQLGRLGGTPFKLGALKNFVVGDGMLPVSELNRLRREAVAELEKLRALPRPWQLSSPGANDASLIKTQTSQSLLTSAAMEPQLIVLVRNLAQLEAALKCGVTTVYCDFEDPKKYREAVTLFRTAFGCEAATGDQPPAIFVAPPRIFKPGDEWILDQVRSCHADGCLVRNYDHLKYFADTRRVGDFSLNVANHLAADYFKNHFGLERITASYDLNVTQLDALLQAAPPAWFEVTIHQHMPMFHMEHCVFCAFLSRGKDFHDCGRPCDAHDVRLRDRTGAEHPVKADAGCRNTVFNSQAQTGAEFVARLLALGVRHFRLEFLNEPPAEIEPTIARYRQLLRGEITGTQLWRELKLSNQLGVTRGQMGK